MQIQLNVAAFFIFFSLTSGYLELVFNQDRDFFFLTLRVVRIHKNEINRNEFRVSTNIAVLL